MRRYRRLSCSSRGKDSDHKLIVTEKNADVVVERLTKLLLHGRYDDDWNWIHDDVTPTSASIQMNIEKHRWYKNLAHADKEDILIYINTDEFSHFTILKNKKAVELELDFVRQLALSNGVRFRWY